MLFWGSVHGKQQIPLTADLHKLKVEVLVGAACIRHVTGDDKVVVDAHIQRPLQLGQILFIEPVGIIDVVVIDRPPIVVVPVVELLDRLLNGEQTDLSKAVFVYELTPGEGAENGIAASKDGAVILTNQNCYLLRANNGVDAVWCTPYESVGAKVSGEGDKTTGGGLAWGGGCSPSLTPELVMFTDNADPVKLLALDMKTGEIVASLPVLDELPDGYQVAVENSAIVYDDSEGTVSTIVCNWFGAGSAGLADPNSDSSIQSYANIYDTNWLTKGNCMIAPGVERVDTIKTDSGYEMKSIWSRNDLSDTSILKLSTATGYIYGYVQDLESGMWQYIILDFETGETIFTMDVSNKFGYNNMLSLIHI